MDRLADLIGESPAVQNLRQEIRRLLARPASSPNRRLPAVLIHGETGTGKGLVARLLHRAGPRASGRFVDVNCAAIPETLLEAELFGFERGAFTDARRSKPGLFQEAHRGTIFLDEIGLLPEPLQAKLLTAIEEQSVRRLGATRPEPCDAWILSATNLDLARAVRERHFREDLYHRLAVISLRLPPLRERGRDVLTLAEHFLDRACEDYGLAPKTLSPDAQARLLSYHWPGNVRELTNVIERVALLADGTAVTADLLDLAEAPAEMEAGGAVSGAAGSVEPAAPAGSLDEAMASHLRRVLEENGGNISRAATRLGISRNTLRARMQRLGMRPGAPLRPEPTPGPPRPRAATTTASAPSARPVLAPETSIRWERLHITMLRAALAVESSADIPDTGRSIEVLVDKVGTFGGRIEELSQSGLDAAFGAEPCEDAPRRAANTALAMQRALERLGDSDAPPLPVRIAVHSGHLLVARIGDAIRIDHAGKGVAGAALDALLARVEPGEIAISGQTAAFLERRFNLTPLGGAGDVDDGARRLAGREGTGLGMWGRLGRFVGRRQELDLMQSRVAAAARARGQLVGVVGEPGVGKSRLAWELARHHLPRGWRVLATSAASFSHAAPYVPVVALLRDYFDIGESASPGAVRERVEQRVGELDEILTVSLPALFALLEVSQADAPWEALDPSQRRQRTLDAVKHLLLRHSRQQPLLLIVEDAQWIDSESQAVLDALVDALPTASIVVVVTYRPEYRHLWGNRGCYTQVRVDPLPPESAEELVQSLVGGDPTLKALTESLIAWTEGNPFFLEECARTLVETGVLAGERGAYRLAHPVTGIQVPATVDEVLAARMRRLPPEESDLLHCAAVIGRDVPRPVLEAIVDRPGEELQRGLAHLQEAEFLYVVADHPEAEFTFKHALTHEVAYQSLPPDRRRALHVRILAAMESAYADRLSEHLDRLAHHAFRGQDWEAALGYLRRAGGRALVRSANREAATCYEQALEALRHLPPGRERTERAIDLRFDLRTALQPLGDFAPMVECLQEAESLAEELGDQRRLARACAYSADAFRLMGRQDRALEWGERALGLADSLGDLGLQVVTNTYIGQAYHDRGDYRRAIPLFRKNVEALVGDLEHERFGSPQPRAVHSRTCLIWCLTEVGEFEEATRRGEEAVRIGRSLDHPLSLATAYAGMGYLHLRRGDLDAACRELEPALELAAAGNSPLWIPRIASCLGLARALAGRVDEALPLLADAVERSISMNLASGHSLAVASLAEGYLLAGRPGEALETARRALALARERTQRGHEAQALRLLAETAWRAGPPEAERALDGARDALVRAGGLGMRPLVGRCHLTLGRIHRERGEAAPARRHLTAGAELLRALDMPLWLAHAETEIQALP